MDSPPVMGDADLAKDILPTVVRDPNPNPNHDSDHSETEDANGWNAPLASEFPFPFPRSDPRSDPNPDPAALGYPCAYPPPPPPPVAPGHWERVARRRARAARRDAVDSALAAALRAARNSRYGLDADTAADTAADGAAAGPLDDGRALALAALRGGTGRGGERVDRLGAKLRVEEELLAALRASSSSPFSSSTTLASAASRCRRCCAAGLVLLPSHFDGVRARTAQNPRSPPRTPREKTAWLLTRVLVPVLVLAVVWTLFIWYGRPPLRRRWHELCCRLPSRADLSPSSTFPPSSTFSSSSDPDSDVPSLGVRLLYALCTCVDDG